MVVQTRSPRQEDGAPEASLGDLTVTLVSKINKRKKKKEETKANDVWYSSGAIARESPPSDRPTPPCCGA